MQAFMMDLAADPAIAEAIIRKVAGYTRTLALETARAGVDVLCFYDDAGTQTGMQISPAMWRRFIKPRWRDILDAVRDSCPDCLFFLHSCGKIEEIIPDVIDLGFHILHPVQPECMAFEDIRRRYGRDLVLCACISAQKLFPFGTPDDVRAWVRRVKHLCRPDNRAILCPSNMIQPETPWENIVAFAAAARERA
jgi:uroporphyrinogen decarboxylase